MCSREPPIQEKENETKQIQTKQYIEFFAYQNQYQPYKGIFDEKKKYLKFFFFEENKNYKSQAPKKGQPFLNRIRLLKKDFYHGSLLHKKNSKINRIYFHY